MSLFIHNIVSGPLWGFNGCYYLIVHLILPTAANMLHDWALVPAKCPLIKAKVEVDDTLVWRDDICDSFQL